MGPSSFLLFRPTPGHTPTEALSAPPEHAVLFYGPSVAFPRPFFRQRNHGDWVWNRSGAKTSLFFVRRLSKFASVFPSVRRLRRSCGTAGCSGCLAFAHLEEHSDCNSGTHHSNCLSHWTCAEGGTVLQVAAGASSGGPRTKWPGPESESAAFGGSAPAPLGRHAELASQSAGSEAK